MPLDADIDFEGIASRTGGFSGADLSGLAREAGLRAMARDGEKVALADVEGALADIRPSITKEMLAFYESFEAGTKIR